MLIAAQWPAHEYHAHRVHPNGLGPQPFRRRQCSARTSTRPDDATTRSTDSDMRLFAHPKRHTVPSRTETGRQSGGRRPGLKLEVPAVGRDWMGLGLGSAGRRPGPGLARD